MNSSTSSSEPTTVRKTLWLIAIFLLMVIIGLEVLTRKVLLPNSVDFVRFAGYPENAKVLCEQPGLRIAFVGNSATQRGIDQKQFIADLSNPKQSATHADFFLADGSMINTWYFLVKDSFWRPQRNPDWMVIHFFESCLEDGDRFEIGRLALYFTEYDDWPELFAIDLPTTSDRAEYLLSTTWATYAVRDRIKKRAMNVVVPDYKQFVEELNVRQFGQEKKAVRAKPVTHRALERFLDNAKNHHTNICFVAFPTDRKDRAVPYELNADAMKRIRDAGMRLIDLRVIPELQTQHYEDPIHLTTAGAAIYTRHFTKAFAELLKQ